MNTDIRLQMSFYNNTKVKRLNRTLGADAVLSLIYLWLYTAENRPHGELRGMDEIDISVAAQWSGDPAVFVAALCDLRFLDKKRNLFSVHDWQSNNPWACDAPARKEKAKKAAEAKWLKKNGKKVCSEQNLAMLNDAQSYAPSPSPSPSPSPKEERTADTIPFHEIIAAYNLFCPSLPKVNSLNIPPSRHQLIKAAWLKYQKTEEGASAVIDTLFKKAEASSFLTRKKPGFDGQYFHAKLDWLFDENKMVKVLEGDYDDPPEPPKRKREFVL
jgi:hypothetical protein